MGGVMERRTFLKSLLGAISAVALPVPTARGAAGISEVVFDGFLFQTAFFDYCTQVGVAITLPDGRMAATRRLISNSMSDVRNKDKIDAAILQCKQDLLEWAETTYAKAA